MAWTRCPKCGYRESDGRTQDRETYTEVCSQCARTDYRALAESVSLPRLISEDNRNHSVKA